jgi:hypothetical protein
MGRVPLDTGAAAVRKIEFGFFGSIPGGSGTLTHVSSHFTHFCWQWSMYVLRYYGTSRNMYVSIAPLTAKYVGLEI